MDDIDKWLRPVTGLNGFPARDDAALGEHVRHERNVCDVRLFGRVFDRLAEAEAMAIAGDRDGVRAKLEAVSDLLADLRVPRDLKAFRRTVDATLALLDAGELGARAAASLSERMGRVVATFDAAVELAVALCIDESVAVNAGEWAVRKIVRKETAS